LSFILSLRNVEQIGTTSVPPLQLIIGEIDLSIIGCFIGKNGINHHVDEVFVIDDARMFTFSGIREFTSANAIKTIVVGVNESVSCSISGIVEVQSVVVD